MFRSRHLFTVTVGLVLILFIFGNLMPLLRREGENHKEDDSAKLMVLLDEKISTLDVTLKDILNQMKEQKANGMEEFARLLEENLEDFLDEKLQSGFEDIGSRTKRENLLDVLLNAIRNQTRLNQNSTCDQNQISNPTGDKSKLSSTSAGLKSTPDEKQTTTTKKEGEGSSIPPRSKREWPHVVTHTKEEERLMKEMFDRYSELHHEILHPSLTEKKGKNGSVISSNDKSPTKRRFILVRPSPSGLGNEVESAMSALILGIVTDRAVLIQNSVSEVWESVPKEEGGVDLFAGIYEDSGLEGLSRKEFSMVGGVDDCPTVPLFEICACKNLSTAPGFSEFDVIVLTSNQYFAPLIQNNPHYRDMFARVFGRDIFGPIFRRFFRARQEFSDKIEKFKSEHQFDDRYVIGIHMREEYIHTRPQPIAVDEFFLCALQATPSQYRNITRYYVATDKSEYIEAGKRILGENKILTGDGSRGMDILMVGEGDDVIATTGSTFSDIAFASHSKLPLKVTEVLLCMRDVQSQPCFFFFKHALQKASCYPKDDKYSLSLYRNPIFLNTRNCYHNFQWGEDHY
eukprot:TRINITY_DN4722_c0_g1_i1.p1 TRINITY_DN4722_c0_g1~~TRINITY_DN4722_c0_g1_i1.p1  ORF type:complete len:572 (-),score=140.38 TRINITY_DN4722_c0_g1_i1:113-1828(-)